MGNTIPSYKGPRNRLAIVAMAQQMTLTQTQLKLLLDQCILISAKKKSFKISRRDFRSAMNQVGVEPRFDADVLDLLFTMWDEKGSNRIQYRNFCTSLSPLATSDNKADLFSMIEYALKIMDVTSSGHISKRNLDVLVKGILSTAAYFGDPVLSPDEMDCIVDDLFEQNMGRLRMSHSDCVIHLARHPLVLKFVMGAGTYFYGCKKVSPEDVELETSWVQLLTCGVRDENAASDQQQLVTYDLIEKNDEFVENMMGPESRDDSEVEEEDEVSMSSYSTQYSSSSDVDSSSLDSYYGYE